MIMRGQDQVFEIICFCPATTLKDTIMTKNQAETLDKMLVYLQDRCKIHTRTRIFTDEVSVFLGLSKNEVEALWDSYLSVIKHNNVNVVEYIYHPGNVSIRANFNTELFLKYGGFSKYFQEEKEKEEEQEKFRDLEYQKLNNDIATFNITKKQYQWNKWLAIAGFLLALTSLVIQLFNK